MVTKFLVLLALVANFISNTQSSNIFFYFVHPIYSHRRTVWPLVEKLGQRGHNVTFCQSLPSRGTTTPGVTEFIPPLANIPPPTFQFLSNRIKSGWLFNIRYPSLFRFGLNSCETFLKEPEVKAFIANTSFDLVVIDELLSECGYALAHVWKAKTVIFAPSTLMLNSGEPMGLLDESNSISNIQFDVTSSSYFLQRVLNQVAAISNYIFRSLVYYPKMEETMRKHLGEKFSENFTSLQQLVSETSLVMVNTHFTVEGVRNLPPFYIYVGGMNLKVSEGGVSQEIQSFIDSDGEDGFFYVSFGTNIKFSNLPLKLMLAFTDAFTKSSMKFLLKWEGPVPDDMPSNVYASSWFSQAQLLQSPKCRGFINHGGINGILEAIAGGVPMIIIPIFGDQDYNAMNQKRFHRAIVLELSTLTSETLSNAFLEILQNKSYKENVMSASGKFNDRPQSPLDTALFWIEYVLRHNNTVHLKSGGYDQYWFQRRLLDVWVFIVATILTTALTFYYVTKLFVKYLLCRIWSIILPKRKTKKKTN